MESGFIDNANGLSNNENNDFIIVPTVFSDTNSIGYKFISKKSILYLKSDSNYTQIFTCDNSKIQASKNLGYFERQLGQPFIRIHNSFIINSIYLLKYNKGERCNVTIKGEIELPVSMSKRDALDSLSLLGEIIVCHDEHILIKMKYILYIESQGNNTKIYLANYNKPFIQSSKKLDYYQNNLKSSAFIRINERQIINLNHTVKYLKGKTAYLVLSTGKTLFVSESKKPSLMKILMPENSK